MSLVPSLLQAIISVDGEALVMHAGDKPYVVAPTGQVELASRGLTLEAVSGIVAQLLPIEAQKALEEFGAIQHELAPQAAFPGESFTIVAARGGDDLWAEIRRRKIPDEDSIPEELFAQAGAPSASTPIAAGSHQSRPAAGYVAHADRPAPPVEDEEEEEEELTLPSASELLADARPRQQTASSIPPPAPPQRAAPPPIVASEPTRPAQPAPAPTAVPPRAGESAGSAVPFVPPAPTKPAVTPTPTQPVAPPAPAPRPPPLPPAAVAPPPSRPPAPPAAPLPPVVPPPPIPLVAPAAKTPPAPPSAPSAAPVPEAPRAAPTLAAGLFTPPQPAVVLPMLRSPIRADTPPPVVANGVSGLDRLLRLAAARGASTLYVSSHARPSVRVDGEVQMLDGEPLLGPNDVESLLLTLMPERNHEQLRSGVATEWICDVEGVGRVRCMSFRDHQGPGGVFRMMPLRAVSTEQLGLTRDIEALAVEPEGLVLVAGPRLSGKRTLISAFVDLINRARRDHVITIESEINVVHDRGTSFISQREVRGNDEEVVAVAREALREDPDVLVIESLRTAALINVALEAAAVGQLVIGGLPAHNATAAVDRIINLYPAEHRRQVQLALAENLRGIVAQVLLRKSGGGRLPAREVLLNTPAVASVIAEGRTSQLPMAIEGGRKQGMVPLNDALVGLVQSGTVDVREAYRRAPDRAGFYALLKRLGMDTSPLERLA